MKLIRFSIVLSLFLGLAFSTPGRSAMLAGDSAQAWSPLIITSPTSLSPMPDSLDPLCKTYWYMIENAGGYPAYLTLNVKDESGSTNSGEWRPNIPTTGFYKVEVYIPAHDPIDWNCSGSSIINSDTTNAVYKVTGPLGTTAVSVNQAANPGTWVSLGNYYLSRGIDNVLQLTDITGENNFDYSVSFSMARFTWLPTQTTMYFPIVYKDFDQASLTEVNLDSVTPYAREGITRLRFDMDEPVTYRISGTNGYADPETVLLAWQYVGPCGYGPEYTTSLDVPAGSWIYDFGTSIAACPGQNTVYIRIFSRGAMLQKSLTLNIDAGGTLQLYKGQAFDSCGLPSFNDFTVWWNQSPYEVYNIYLGGISLFDGCKSTRLNRDFIRDVQNIGWGFIATWVGPQAPCYNYKYPFSWDVNAAYNEGKLEAQMAATKAKILGLVEAANSNTVLYYDLENFRTSQNTSDPNHPCRLAAKSFINGWVEQLHSYGLLAGVYGGSYGSFLSDYSTIPSVPDTIWAAEWNIERVFDPQASVYNLKWLGDEFWNNDRRLRQYAGDHDEAWGGNQMNIDSDVSDTKLFLPRFPTNKPPVQYDLASIGDSKVVDFQLITPEEGWLLDRSTLYSSHDGGQTWQALPVPLTGGTALEKVFFLNPLQGWLVGASQAGYTLFSTIDGGATWKQSSLPDFGPADPLELTFMDLESGVIKFRFQTSQAFREGYLLQTVDGGQTWQQEELAQDDPAWEQGQFLAAGKSAVSDKSAPDGALQVKWVSESQGWATVFRGACSRGGGQSGYTCQSAVVLESTSDSGKNWGQVYP